MTWPVQPTTSNRQARIEISRPCIWMVMVVPAEGRTGLGRPDDVGLGLLAGGVEVLLEVAVAMHQRDGHHGGAGVGCRTERIAGEHAEAAGVGREVLAEGDFHGEVRDLAVGKVDGSGGGKRLTGRRDWFTHAQSRIHFSKRCTQ